MRQRLGWTVVMLVLVGGAIATAARAADGDGDGVMDGVDLCPGTAIPESVPTLELSHNHYALMDDDGVFDTTRPGVEGIISTEITVEMTAGCSCEQIVAFLGVGGGHLKYGCSPSVMARFLEGPASSLIFTDDFESGDPSRWSATQPPG